MKGSQFRTSNVRFQKRLGQIITERGCLSVARFCYEFLCELRVPGWAVGSHSTSPICRGKSPKYHLQNLATDRRPHSVRTKRVRVELNLNQSQDKPRIRIYQIRAATMSVRSKRNHRSESRERQQRKKPRREESDESPESDSGDEMDLERELHPIGCVWDCYL